MKRILIISLLLLSGSAVFSQQVASRAKAMRMMTFSRPEYQIKDIKVYTDTMTVYALFANDDRKLVPGGTVSVTIASKRGVMRPAIPPTAVLQDTQGPYVWAVAEDGRVERRTIARGDVSGDWMFVEKGLKVGERVVADGAHKVRRGDTVKAAQ